MNISSTPFIRNDYWPDYNDINELNKRIDETENEISLVNIRLSTDIENVSNNLNSYINNQANTTITNNIIVNSLNANYAEGKFANFTNTNTDNAYVENLTVNKPVFDITLNTPHIENTTSLGGNFYNTNLIDPKFSGDASGDFNTINVDVINANTANISNLFVNTQPEPVTSSAVLGYDSEGRVIPVHATYDVSFPENANYLFTDSFGTALAGTAATEVGETNNLITSFAVKNALDDYANNVNDSFNLVNNTLNDIDNWQNSLENSIANSFNDVNNGFNDVNNTFNDVNNFVNNGFNDVNNTFNDVNNFVNNGFNDVNNGFNDVNNTFNDVNNFVNNGFNDVNNTFNDVNNSFVEYTSILNILNTLIPVSFSNADDYSSDSTTVNYQKVQAIKFTTPADTTGANISTGPQNPVYITFDAATNTLKYTSNALVINETMFRVFSTYMEDTFKSCTNLNQNILIPNSVTKMLSTFGGCTNLNQNILIPNSVTEMFLTFGSCKNLNQNILIPNSVTDISSVFSGCTNLNKDIYIYSQNIGSMSQAFSGTQVSRVHIPTSVPKVTSNSMYNRLVNGSTGITFSAANIFNDLPVDIAQWPPV